MEFAFYICGLVAILATLRVITHTNPVHALLYLIISLLAIAGVFFSLGTVCCRPARSLWPPWESPGWLPQ